MAMQYVVHFTLVLVFGVPLFALPVKEDVGRWGAPCSQSTVPATDMPTVEITMKKVIESLKRKSSEAAEGAALVQDLYRSGDTARITSDRILDYLELVHLNGLEIEHLRNHSMTTLPENMTGALLVDYEQLSVLAVYWEKMIEDEVFYEHSKLEPQMTEAEHTLYNALCDLHTGIHKVLGASIDRHVQRSYMPSKQRDVTNDSQRYFRDYLIARDSSEILTLISQRYNGYLSHM